MILFLDALIKDVRASLQKFSFVQQVYVSKNCQFKSVHCSIICDAHAFIHSSMHSFIRSFTPIYTYMHSIIHIHTRMRITRTKVRFKKCSKLNKNYITVIIIVLILT